MWRSLGVLFLGFFAAALGAQPDDSSPKESIAGSPAEKGAPGSLGRMVQAEKLVKQGVQHRDRREFGEASALLTKSKETYREIIGEDDRRYV
ncbi:MAG TPA: hypothetical protein VKD71_02805 [Gemmataceae bacterium]|nr:hypothetical protein [Gemmataceae bacterium]